jgi:hypothetical protein
MDGGADESFHSRRPPFRRRLYIWQCGNESFDSRRSATAVMAVVHLAMCWLGTGRVLAGATDMLLVVVARCERACVACYGPWGMACGG